MGNATNEKPRQVLVIEDHRSVARMLLLALREAGFEVEQVATGKAALLVLAEGLPDAESYHILELKCCCCRL